jgi:hypothetical protein
VTCAGAAATLRASPPRGHGDEGGHRGEAHGHTVSQDLHTEARERQVGLHAGFPPFHSMAGKQENPRYNKISHGIISIP